MHNMHAQKIIADSLKRPLEPKPIQYVSEMLDDAFYIGHGYDDSVHARIQKFIEVIKPYIFGYTPMCKALEDAFDVFSRKKADANKFCLLFRMDHRQMVTHSLLPKGSVLWVSSWQHVILPLPLYPILKSCMT